MPLKREPKRFEATNRRDCFENRNFKFSINKLGVLHTVCTHCGVHIAGRYQSLSDTVQYDRDKALQVRRWSGNAVRSVSSLGFH